MRKRMLIDVSAHGYGHAAQTAPVVNRLSALHDFDVTIRSGLPSRVLRERFACPFERISRSVDFGIAMKNAVEVDVPETAARYRNFHRNWKSRVEEEAEWLAASTFDMILCNVPYLPLKAARLAGIPAVAMCSLNWADLYLHYCGEDHIYEEIMDAYRSAGAFLRIEPGMPMAGLDTLKIGPVAQKGRMRRDELREILHLDRGSKLALVSMGGVSYSIPFEKWPVARNVHWLVPDEISRPDMTPFAKIPMPFADLAASIDVLVTKPGYGSFLEAALSGIAVLYVSRESWPEEPFLVDWLDRNARCLEVERHAFESGELNDSVERVSAMPEKLQPLASGIDEAISFLGAFLT